MKAPDIVDLKSQSGANAPNLWVTSSDTLIDMGLDDAVQHPLWVTCPAQLSCTACEP